MTHQFCPFGGHVIRLVTEPRGSWRHQDAYRIARYSPQLRADGKGYIFKAWGRRRSDKIALCKYNRDVWADLTRGTLHNRPARPVVDDYGNLLFVTI